MTLPTPDPAFRWTHEPWGPGLRCAALEQRAQHVFTSRQLKLPDADGWLAACRSVGTSPDRLMRVRQVHGNVVRVVRRGETPPGADLERPDGDAIVSDEPGLILAVMVADCVPILLADEESGAAAAIHAGWRGTCERVASFAVRQLEEAFGTKPEHLVAAIGPSIGPADDEVGESVADAFAAAGHEPAQVDRWFLRSGARPHLDLWTANRDQLINAGLQAERIFTCGLSTLAHTDVFDSFRSDGDRAGRMAALVVVPRGVHPPS